MSDSAGKKDKVVVFVPAYNEELWLPNVLKPLVDAKNRGVVDEVVVVDDGSTDKTSDVAKGFDVALLGGGARRGKFEAFKTFLKRAVSSGADVVMVVDADMTDLTPEAVEAVLKPILNQDKLMMSRTEVMQGETLCPLEYSGFRAVRVAALKSLLLGSKAWSRINPQEARGLELELYFERNIDSKVAVEGLFLKSRPAGAGSTPLDLINMGLKQVRTEFEDRDRAADGLLSLRQLRKTQPNDSRARDKSTGELRQQAERFSPKDIETITQHVGVGKKPNKPLRKMQ